MNLAHLHLLLNHVPTLGMVFGVGLLVLSLLRQNRDVSHISLEVLYMVALLTLPAYLTGMASQKIVTRLAPDALAAIERHHDAAMVASLFMLLTGSVSWFASWRARRAGRPFLADLGLVFVLALATLGLMARAGTMGGAIRHPEIVASTNAPGPAWLSARAVATFVNDREWVWPAFEALHFIGLWLLFGVLLLVNLRLLGMMKAASFDAVHKLLPWAAMALGVNVVTGMLFVIALPDSYLTNTAFHWKVGLLVAAGANLLYLTEFEAPWSVGPDVDAPLWAKTMAASSLALWVGVMYFGRMLPFIGNAY